MSKKITGNYQFGFINKTITKIKTLFYELLFHPIIMNAFIYQTNGKIMHRNWGDDINYFFLSRLFRKRIVCYDYSILSHRYNKDNYMMIGSSLTLLCNAQTIVWGSGVIDPKQKLPAKPKKVLAVRGPLTRTYLLQHGINCPEIYGDPALLLPYYYRPQLKKQYKLGIIPHYQDYEHPEVKRLSKERGVLLIQTENYSNWIDFIDQINSCECIVSSSLHGLIVAEAYEIPNVWIELSGELLGGHFKFYDFFASIQKRIDNPYRISTETNVKSLIDECLFWKRGEINLMALASSSPFPLFLKYPIKIDYKNE